MSATLGFAAPRACATSTASRRMSIRFSRLGVTQMPVSARRNRRSSRGISIRTTWQMTRPVRNPAVGSSTAFIKAGVAIWPFINARALPDFTSATAAAAIAVPSAWRIAKPSRAIPCESAIARMRGSGPTRIGRTQPRSAAIRIASRTVGSSPPAAAMRHRLGPGIGISVQAVESVERHLDQSSTRSWISSELARSSGAYIAWARAGRAWNRPGISARRRYETLCLPRARVRAKKATRSSRNST